MAYDLLSGKQTDQDFSIGVSDTDMMGFSVIEKFKEMPAGFKVALGLAAGIGGFMFVDWYKNSRNTIVRKPPRRLTGEYIEKTHQLPKGESMDEIVRRRLR